MLTRWNKRGLESATVSANEEHELDNGRNKGTEREDERIVEKVIQKIKGLFWLMDERAGLFKFFVLRGRRDSCAQPIRACHVYTEREALQS